MTIRPGHVFRECSSWWWHIFSPYHPVGARGCHSYNDLVPSDSCHFDRSVHPTEESLREQKAVSDGIDRVLDDIRGILAGDNPVLRPGAGGTERSRAPAIYFGGIHQAPVDLAAARRKSERTTTAGLRGAWQISDEDAGELRALIECMEPSNSVDHTLRDRALQILDEGLHPIIAY